MTDLSDLTPRQLAVASMVARCWTAKHIAYTLDITPRRVYALIASVASKIGCEHGMDDREVVRDWWRNQTRTAA